MPLFEHNKYEHIETLSAWPDIVRSACPTIYKGQHSKDGGPHQNLQ